MPAEGEARPLEEKLVNWRERPFDTNSRIDKQVEYPEFTQGDREKRQGDKVTRKKLREIICFAEMNK